MTTCRPAQSRNSEEAFLAGYNVAAYRRPSVAVDVVLLTVTEGTLRVLLLRRDQHPHRGSWCLPGGFVHIDEDLDAAAARVIAEKAGVRQAFIEQLYTFGRPKRDPRTRVISVAFYALVDAGRLSGVGTRGSERIMAGVTVPWQGEHGGPARAFDARGASLELGFDHADILGMAVKRLRGKLNYSPIGFQLLPAKFTLRQLQGVHETILGERVNKDAFRRRVLASEQLRPTGVLEDEVGHRPAELYRFTAHSAL